MDFTDKNMKLINILLKENKDCTELFDIDSVYKDYVEFNMPLYSIINKGRTATLEYIKPDQYIYNVARGFGLSYQDSLSAVDNNKIKKYSEDMIRGDKFPVPYYINNKSGQEGRHRAMAAKQLGCEVIPVIKIEELTPQQIRAKAMIHRGDTFEEVNDYYLDRGFKNGITQKCWYDLQSYIERNS